MIGWIKLHRQILDNPIARKPAYAWVWVCLLIMANHEDNEFIWNKKKQVCKRGQVYTGRDKLALVAGVSAGTVENILNYLESEQQIEQQKTTKFRLITILKYDQYQMKEQKIEQQNDNRMTTDEQQNDTNKKEKNVKKEKNEKIIPKEYGNAEVNAIINCMEECFGTLDSTKEKNRQYAWLLLKKSKNNISACIALVRAASQHDWWKSRITKVETIYKNAHLITNALKEQSEPKKGRSLIIS